MDASEHLQSMRDKYVQWYRSVIRSKRAEGVQCAPEVWVEPNVPPGKPRPPHPLCVDLMMHGKEPPEMAMITAEPIDGPLIAMMQVRNVPVKLYAATWEALPVWVRHSDPDWSALDPWKAKWMDVNRTSDGDDDGLCGVVHYLGVPIAEGGGFFYLADFGSAPIESVLELLDTLAAMGVTEIELGQSDGSDLPADMLAELRRADLPIVRLTAILADLIGTLDEVASVTQVSEEEIVIQRKGCDEASHAYTANLHRLLQRSGIEARPREVYRFVRTQRELLAGTGTAHDLSQLRLVIKDDRFIQGIRDMGPKMKALVLRRLAGDLWTVCVWDTPNGMRFATEEDPALYGLTAEQMLDRAKQNSLAARPEVKLDKDGDLLVARTGDCYDATLLVDDDWWDGTAATIKGELLACAPARHVVLAGDSRQPGTVQQMQRAAQRIEAGGDHLISDTILVRRGGRWELFAAEPQLPKGTALPQRRPDPATRPKRPWWRFW